MYKLRNSESNNSPELVKFTQGGILLRFNIIETTKDEVQMYEYKEFWVELNESNIETIVANEGFELTNEHKQLLL